MKAGGRNIPTSASKKQVELETRPCQGFVGCHMIQNGHNVLSKECYDRVGCEILRLVSELKVQGNFSFNFV